MEIQRSRSRITRIVLRLVDINLEAMAEVLCDKRVLERKDLKESLSQRGHTIDWRDKLTVKDADGTVIEEGS